MEKPLIKRVDYDSEKIKQVDEFLASFGLFLEKDVEYTITAEINKKIVGTCSYAKNTIKCFAIKKEYQGEGISEMLLTEITNVMFDKGIYESFIFTKPENKYLFEGFGYKEVHTTDDVALLESNTRNIKRYTENMFAKSNMGKEEKAALVVNCNPFTLGHKYLIEKASKENTSVVVFVVEEDLSLFPFKDRLRLVMEGVKEMTNVTVLKGGDYIISSNTFPTYFLHDKEQSNRIYQELDAGIFGKYIAPVFNIKKRYVGTEPYSLTTKDYNQALTDTLPKYGVEVVLVERLMIEGQPVSASTVRKLIKEDEWDMIQKIVPESTYKYLISEEGKAVVSKIKVSDSRH
jgi:[citrate (pro-3S)-lyase] ligase